jgi:hypothetical protein
MSDFPIGDELLALGRIGAANPGDTHLDWERADVQLQQQAENDALRHRVRAALVFPLKLLTSLTRPVKSARRAPG